MSRSVSPNALAPPRYDLRQINRIRWLLVLLLLACGLAFSLLLVRAPATTFSLAQQLALAASLIAILLAAALICRVSRRSLSHQSGEINRQQQRLRQFMDNACDLIIAFDDDQRIHYLNQIGRQRLGLAADEPLPAAMEALLAPSQQQLWHNRTCLLGVAAPFEPTVLLLRDRQGGEIQVDCRISSDRSGQPQLHWLVGRDLSEKIAADQQLHYLANHDRLTGLRNRHSFTEAASQAARLAQRYHQQLALALFSIDHLKIINETLGNENGDELLEAFSKRLHQSVRETDLVGRLAGNQFVVLFLQVDGPLAVEQVLEKIRRIIAAPLPIAGQELFITTSIGLSLFPQHASCVDALIKTAGDALYSVKTRGGNGFQFYSPQLGSEIKNRLAMINGLHQALDRNELQLRFQPKVRLDTGGFDSVEVLLRWQHPELGQVPPGDFIPMAEESGVIGDLTLWVLRQACQQCLAWLQQGLPPVRMAVNVSGHQLQNRELLLQLKTLLSETGLAPELLEIEITESILMQNPEAARTLLGEIRELGIHLAIDDFGTGFSSLAYLKRFPVHSLKIDRAFIKDLEQSERCASLTAAILAMGRSLQLNLIAEGVETLGQLAFLREHLCDEAQGFLYSTPVSAGEIAQMLSNLQNRRTAFEVAQAAPRINTDLRQAAPQTP
ncbi:putative bifunctional diguanylate cyclase/phosphodiesterase [Desulfuromonas thiophila]|uniref:PAS domain S-box-containing protein/diguanylate cyclase (GGDEF) domain-containing protein n=1 Tax=Desulfuromonas thiophila TaxID=57664 RepID=A0A1G6WYQ6_9BACT|nr:EAL domain-containing protein [Desulfuromonas thiophila]SDD70924.1 PAS domain S-box-containing protein/diguanylate cyclase (GGDEF) domain-containing protein [Desulfuromonas thiophila]